MLWISKKPNGKDLRFKAPDNSSIFKFNNMSFFSDVLVLYHEYYTVNKKNRTEGFNNDLAWEGREKILQLDYLIQKIKDLEHQAIESTEKSRKAFTDWIEYIRKNNLDPEKTPVPSNIYMNQDAIAQYDILCFELQLHTEHFYYIAFRLRGIVKYLPGLKKFEAAGIRDVRNKLIEHPEKDKKSQVFERSFGFGGKSGPAIKAMRNSKQTGIFPDKGIYVNAQELKTNLEQILSQNLDNKID